MHWLTLKKGKSNHLSQVDYLAWETHKANQSVAMNTGYLVQEFWNKEPKINEREKVS